MKIHNDIIEKTEPIGRSYNFISFFKAERQRLMDRIDQLDTLIGEQYKLLKGVNYENNFKGK